MDNAAQFGSVNYIVLCIYLVAMVGVGIWMARRQRTTEDYFLAGRRMPWVVVGMSIFASLASAISYLGIPSMGFSANISLICGYFVGPISALLLIWLFYPFYHKLQVTTSYEYLGMRFGRGGRLSVSTLFLLARLGWLGNVIYAPALALSVVTGLNLWLTILLMGVLATSYTALGGMSAVLWTDVVQFIILVGGGLWVSVSLIQSVPDGITGIWQVASEHGRTGGFWTGFSLTEMTAAGAMICWIFNHMQEYGTDQVTIQRIMSVNSFWGKAKAVLLNSMFEIVIVGMLLFIGIGLFAYTQHHSTWLPPDVVDHPDRILPYYIMTGLPNGVSGLVITAIFAAAMSSMDSGIHSMSTVIINDFIRPFRRSAVSDQSDLRLARTLVGLLGICATLIAFWVSRFDHILEASYTIAGMFNGPILAVFLLGVLTRRTRLTGVLMGMVAGVAAAASLQSTSLHFLFFFPIAMFVTLVVGYLASLLVTLLLPRASAQVGQMLRWEKADPAFTIWGRQRE